MTETMPDDYTDAEQDDADALFDDPVVKIEYPTKRYVMIPRERLEAQAREVYVWLGYWRDKMPTEAVEQLQDILGPISDDKHE